MITKIKTFLADPTSINIIVNTLGNYINVFFVALFALILVRIMPPSEYGVLSVLLGISYVLANVLEFGTTATIYSYVPNLFTSKNPQLYRFIKSTFFYQSLFSCSIIAVLLFTFPTLDKYFFKTGAEPWVLHLTSISVLLFIWQNFFTNILFAAKKFLRANIYINIANVIKTIVIFFLAYVGTITVGQVIFVFGILGPMIFFLMLLYKNRTLIPQFFEATIHKEDFKFGYTMTYFIASQFYNLGLRMDLFLLSYFSFIITRQEVGYYGLSQKIILTIIASIVSITQVLSPRFASISTKKDALNEFKIGTLYMLIPSAIFVLLYFTPSFVFEFVFTKEYSQTAGITKALALPFILSAIGSIPTLFLLYTVKKPSYILYSNILFFVILTGGAYLLIPTLKVYGPPIAIFIAFFVAIAVQTFATIKEFKKL